MLLAKLIFLAAKAQDLIGLESHSSAFKKSLKQETVNNSELRKEDTQSPTVWAGSQKVHIGEKETSSWPLADKEKDTIVPNLVNSRTHDIEDPRNTLGVENVASAERLKTTAVKSTAAPLTIVNANGESSLKLGWRENITPKIFLKTQSAILSEASTDSSSAWPRESPNVGSSRSYFTASPAHIGQTEMGVTHETIDPSTSIRTIKSVPADGEVINAQAADLAEVSVSSEKKTTPSISTKSESKSLETHAKFTHAEKKTSSSITIETESKSTEVPAKSTIPPALEASMAPTTKIAEKSTSVEELNQKPDLKPTIAPSPVKEFNTPPKPLSSDHEPTLVTWEQQPSKKKDSPLNTSPAVEPNLKTKENHVIETQIAIGVTQIPITDNSMWEPHTVRPSSTSSEKTKEKPNTVVPKAAPIIREPLSLKTTGSSNPEKSNQKPSGSAQPKIEFNESLEDKNTDRSSNSYTIASVILLVFLTCGIIRAVIYFWRWIEPIWFRRWSGYSRVRRSDSISDLEMDAFDHEAPSDFISDRDRFLIHRGVAPRCPTKVD